MKNAEDGRQYTININIIYFKMINEELKDQIKADIGYWFKENFPGCTMRRKPMKDIVNMLRHEVIHYKIYIKFVKISEVELIINFSKKNSRQFSYSATCLGHYPLIYSLPRYYFKYIFIEFIQYLYDMIYNILTFRRIKHLIRYTTYFIKTLFEISKKVKRC